MSTTTTTTATTEISSNSNSSCRLLVCLNSLPFHDQRVFRSLLGHTELLRLSACSRSLRNSVRNDRALWQELYHRNFLSGAYYAKEIDFVLWCIRTDVNNPCTSDKRADLLENVDWYNTYRRRVSTENNWRFGRCNTTHIDMEADKNKTPGHSYTLEYLPHSNLRSSNNIVYNSTFSTSPNIISLDSDNEGQYFYVKGDHYIAVSPKEVESDTNYNIKILSCKHGGVFTTFNVPTPYRVITIEGKWILLVNIGYLQYRFSPILNAMVFDIDNSIMCQGSIDDTWHATRFYKTTDNTAIVYTARLVKYDDVVRIEWALYEFSSNDPVVQLRSGWFQLPIRMSNGWLETYSSYDSHMIIGLHGLPDYDPRIIHSVAYSGQSHTPRNCYTISKHHIPIPLLRAGCRYSIFNSKSTKVWTDLTYNDDQVLRIRGTASIDNVIGDLYIFDVKRYNRVYNRLLVDISTKEVIRKLEASSTRRHLKIDAMVGTIGSSYSNHVQIIQEYGEL